jgi:UPF0755 protein
VGKIFKLIAVLFIIALVLALAGGGYCFYKYNQPSPEWEHEVNFFVEPGMTVSSIGRDLEERGALQSYYVFRLIHELKGAKGTIPTGSYTLSPGMTTRAIYEKLVAGEQDMISVTIPEGWTRSKIAARLEENRVCGTGDFLRVTSDRDFISSYGLMADTLEGYLYPDTYRFVFGESAENIAGAMVENFFNEIKKIYPDWEDLTGEQFRDKITMASIVEKEYRIPEEAPLIASVFYNRLARADFPHLQSCATVVYVITENQGRPHPDRLFYRDLNISDPYNTYYADGLPPGAIASPGHDALEASFHPAQTDYIFFVVKDSVRGSHNFSSNYGDFLSDKDNYLESFRSK